MSSDPKDGGQDNAASRDLSGGEKTHRVKKHTGGHKHTGGKSARGSSRPPKNAGPNPRSAARTGAVQALYQMDLAGSDVATVIHEFTTIRFESAQPEAGQPEPDEATAVAAEAVKSADPVFFSELLRGVVRRQRDIDPMIEQQLATGWRLLRIDSILRAILRAGTFELIERHDVPARVIINEYVNVAHAFFSEDEPRVVNGVLDRMAKRLRVAEFDGKRAQDANRAGSGDDDAPEDTGGDTQPASPQKEPGPADN